MANGKGILRKLAIATGVVVAVFAIVLIVVQLILTPNNLKNMVAVYSEKYLDATVKMDTIELHLFKSFPHLTLAIKDGEVVSKVLDSIRANSSRPIPLQADSLLKFKELHVSLSLPHLLASKINIRRIGITSPSIYACILPDGTANYDIFKDGGDEAEDTVQTEDVSDLVISVNRVSIKDGASIVYNSSPDSLYARMGLERLHLRGNFSTDFSKLKFNRAYASDFYIAMNKLASRSDSTHRAAGRFSLDSLNVVNKRDGEFKIAALTRSDLRMNDLVLVKDFPFEINGGIQFDTTYALKGELKDLTVTIAKIPVVFNGIFNITPDSLYTNNICGKVENFHISEIFEYLPENLRKEMDNIKTNASISVDVDVNGSYDFKTGKLPSIMAALDIPESYVEFKGKASRINELETHIKAYYSATNSDSAAVEVNKLVVNGRGIQMALNGKISDIATVNPYVDMHFEGGVFLDTLSSLFPAKSGTVINGNIAADLMVKSRMSNLNLYNIGKADIKGSLVTDSAKIIIPQEDLYAIFQGVRAATAASANTRDTSIKIGTKMLGSNITADSIYFRYKEQMQLSAAKFNLSGHQAADVLSKDTATKRVYPFNGQISANSLSVKGLDSISLRMRAPKIKFSILPYNEDYTIPVLKVETDVKRLMARDAINRISIGNGNIALEAVLNKRSENRVRPARLEKMLDSLQRVYPEVARDSLLAHNRSVRGAANGKEGKSDFAEDDIDFKVDNTLRDLIRQWNVTGSITASNGRITTPYFPLRTRMQNINFGFTTDKIEFDNTLVVAGQSRFVLTGQANGLRRAMLRNGVVNLSGSIVSDTLDFNELITAANRGIEFMDAGENQIDSLAQIADEEMLAQAIAIEDSADSTASAGLIIIPGNIDAKFSLDVKYGIYSNLHLQKMAGEMLIKERCLQINGFEALTDAGNLSLSAFYATRSKEDLSTGFDLELKDMAIEKLIKLMPSVDTLLPMLKSFEGLVNCNITATSKIDTAMNLQLPTLRGVARITGDNLVLMDGETFATIAKKLKFKNREKNYIDRISVELLLNDNRIEVFPFIAEMDRYKFAISGTQNLDLSFLYSISILESPLPFRVGVKIFGNTDDFDFKIGKAQYKSDKLPVYSAVIDSTRVNLRDHIANIYRVGIDAALKTNSIEELQQKKDSHDTQFVDKMDSLSTEEATQLEMVTPAPVPSPEPQPEQ